MNSADYTFLLNQPEAVNDRQTDALEKIVAEFPYFQSARALRLKGLYNQNSFQYNYALKVAAAYTTDRSVLFDFITSDNFTVINKSVYDEKVAEIHDIPVNESQVLDEKSAEPEIDKVEQSILTSIRESESAYEDGPVSMDAEPIAEVLPETEEIEEIDTLASETFAETGNESEAEHSDAADEQTELASGKETAEETSSNPETALPQIDEAAEESPETEVAAAESTPEEKLHIGQPLEFSREETHSFAEWLQLSRLKPIDRETTEENDQPIIEPIAEAPHELIEDKSGKTKKDELIDRFIENNPKIPQLKSETKPVEILQPKEDHTALMTETLARVYLEQKKYQKAIQAYEILILKYPEKSSFFADRISEIKNLQQNNTLQ